MLVKNIELKNRDTILNEPIILTFLRLSLPMLVVRIVQDVYGVVDAFWLGRYNQYAVAIPRQVWPLYMLFTAFITSFSSANLALLSQYIGAGMYFMVNDVTKKMLSISLISGGVFGTLFYILSPYLFKYLICIPSEILYDTIGYAQIMSLDIVFLSLSMSLTTILQSLGDTKLVALSQVIGVMANVFLDPVLINGLSFIPSMGVTGAATATILSKIIGIAILVYTLLRKYQWIELRVIADIDKQYFITSINISLPIFLMNILNSLAFNIQNRLVNIFGTMVTTAFSISFAIFDLANTGLWGLTEGIAIMIGQNLGANNIERSRAIAKKTTLFIFMLVTISSIIIYLAKDIIAIAFITGYGINTKAVEIIYTEYNRFISTTIWTLAFFSLTFSAMSIGRGAGHMLIPTIINIVRLWGFRIGLGYLLALELGLNTMGIYIAFALSNVVGGLSSILWIYRESWAKSIIEKTHYKLSHVLG